MPRRSASRCPGISGRAQACIAAWIAVNRRVLCTTIQGRRARSSSIEGPVTRS
jgi:hypothetical protein